MLEKEVSNRVFRAHLELCREKGVPMGSLLRGLGLGERDLLDPRGRTRWNAYATLMDRAMRALGAPDEMAEIGTRWVERSRALALAGGLVASVREMYLVGCERVLRTLYPTLGLRAHAIDPGALFVEIVVPRPSEGGLAVLHAVLGMLRALPRLVGEPSAAVRAEIAPHEGRFVVSHPTGPAAERRVRTLDEVLRCLDRGARPASTEDVEEMLAIAFDDACLVGQARRLGERLANETRFEALVHRLRTILRDRFACTGFLLRVTPENGRSFDLASGPASASDGKTSRRRLAVAGRDVGSIETPALGLAHDGGTSLFDLVLPWLALGIERCLTQGGPRQQTARLPSVYGLTPRETSVVGLLAQGRTNKEIAALLGLTERTVETHLYNVYRKAGVPNRASLVSAYWTSAGAARPRRSAPSES